MPEYKDFIFDDTEPTAPGVTGIAHLSDLHFRPEHTGNEKFRIAFKQSLLEQKGLIHVVICSGDLVDNPELRRSDKNYLKAAQTAREWLETLCRELGIDPVRRLLVVPGNHDYRSKGLLPKSSVLMSGLRAINEATRRIVRASYGTRFSPLSPVRSDKHLFAMVFGNYMRPLFLPNLGVCILDVNSNSVSSVLDLGTGEFSDDERNDFVGKAATFKQSRPEEFARARKIAVLHHHPMPIPRSESLAEREYEPTLLLRNAGSFLNEMIANDVDLILHGHKHYEGYCTAAFQKEDGTLSKPIDVLSAGTIGVDDVQNYSYNLLRAHRDGAVDCRRVSRDVGVVEKFRVGEAFDLFGQDRRKVRFDRLALKHKSKAVCDEQFHFYETTINGDSHSIIEYKWLTPYASPTFDRLPYKTDNLWSMLAQSEYRCLNQPNQKIELEPTSEPNAGNLVFDPPVKSSDPLFVESQGISYAAFAFTKEDCLKKYTVKRSHEEHAIRSKHKISRRLVLAMKFPEGFPPQNLRADVVDDAGQKDLDELQYVQQRFFYMPAERTARLYLDYPLPGFKYAIAWDLPSEHELLGANEANTAIVMEKRLVNLKGSKYEPGVTAALNEFFAAFLEGFLEGSLAGEDPNDYEVGLIARDRGTDKLEYVAGIEPSRNPIYTKLELGMGSGIESLSYTSRRAYFLDNRQPGWDSLHPKNSWNADKVMVCCIPFYYPRNCFYRTVYVLRIATRSSLSGLLKMTEGAPEAGTLRDHFHTVYGEVLYDSIGKALGFDDDRIQNEWINPLLTSNDAGSIL
jgi:3',5'-cyclic AMP phosphodiesterase CpdA